MKIAAIQLANRCGDPQASFAAAERLLERAAREGAAIAALPELSTCGYIPNVEVWRHAESLDGPTAAWAGAAAKRFGLHVGAGFLETNGIDFFNSYLIAAPDGTVCGRVRKMKVEPHVFKPSDAGSVIDTGLGRIAVGICADSHVATFYDRMAALEFDLLLLPHAWTMPWRAGGPVKEADIADALAKVDELCRAWAEGFGVGVVFANPVGEAPAMRGVFGRLTSGFQLRGGSGVFLPDGTSVRLPGEDEGMVTVDVALGRTRTVPLRPVVHDGWLHEGSRFSRKVLGPLDTALGRRHYERGIKALRAPR